MGTIAEKNEMAIQRPHPQATHHVLKGIQFARTAAKHKAFFEVQGRDLI